jgi:putative salt-induced outer membrane protein YdiY
VPNLSIPSYDLWSSDSWLYPSRWEGSLELGLNGLAGNAEALSIRAGGTFKRVTEYHELSGDLTYIKATNDGRETAHNAIFNGRDERLLGESPWSLFLTTGLEYDEFRSFDMRLAVAAGVGYRFVDNELTTLAARFGSGVSREFGGPDVEWVPEANFGLDYERQITELQKMTARIDYFPEWGEFKNYRLNTSFSWEVLLDKQSNMSLKLSSLNRYDSTPNGLKPNDIAYSALLLWKF